MYLSTDVKNIGNISFCVRVGHYDSEQHPVTVTVSANETVFTLEGHDAFEHGNNESIPLAIIGKTLNESGEATTTIDLFSDIQIGLKRRYTGLASSGICHDMSTMMERLDETRAILSEANDLSSFFDVKQEYILRHINLLLSDMANLNGYNVNKINPRSVFRMMMLIAGTKLDDMSPKALFSVHGYLDKHNHKDSSKPFIISIIERLSGLTEASMEGMDKERLFVFRTLRSTFSAMFVRYPVFFESFVAGGCFSHFNSVTTYLSANPEIDHNSMAMIVMSEIYRHWLENY